MAKEFLTDEQVEVEIARLRESEYVKLARKQSRLRYQRRQALYQLRNLEKCGKALAAAGLTLDMLDEMSYEDTLTWGREWSNEG